MKSAQITRHALKRGTRQPDPIKLTEVLTTWDEDNGYRVVGFDSADDHRRWSISLDDATVRELVKRYQQRGEQS